MNNKLMKKNIVLKYEIGKVICGYGFYGAEYEDCLKSKEELSKEIFTETDKELEVGKNYIINDVEFIIEEEYFDVFNDCFVYHTNIRTIDENLEEKYKVEIDLQAIKYKELQVKYDEKCKEYKKICNELKDCKNKKFPFSLFK